MATYQPEAPNLAPAGQPDLNHGAFGIDDNVSAGATAFKAHSVGTMKAAEAVDYLRKNPDPTVTRAAHLANIERRTERVVAEFERSYKVARQELEASLADATRKLAGKLSVRETAYASEVRRVLLAMPAEERLATVRKAFNDGDMNVIGAIYGGDAPAILTGVDRSVSDPLYNQFKLKTAPAEMAAIKQHQRYLSFADMQHKAMLNWEVKATAGTGGHAAAAAKRKSLLASYEPTGFQNDPEPEAE
ncbi:hypothetical protein QP166_07520 [Sphingomonas sp. LR60]|uniref:hypothetical protein n=1 Tax=Sphingomonas sp. LR60 TaxID=3050233 RepID=UPI002FE37A5B